jgi:hypothetical protein
MGKFIYEGVGVPIVDWEEDYLWIESGEPVHELAASTMIQVASGVDGKRFGPAWSVPGGVPPAFRVRIEITAEECTEEESQAVWERRQRGDDDA